MVELHRADFYTAFEDRYRGSRETIKDRLRVYLPFVEPLKALHPDFRAIDLGCGRGEWLELLKEAGIDARGVDLSEAMLEACRERGLAATRAEAVATLKALDDESHALVSGFHLAEHIPFPDLQVLVQEALRVLAPGGLLVLESPNPENIEVAGSGFWLDPTHERPLPPLLLSFLSEHYGYRRTKILRLQEPAGLAQDMAPTLFDVLAKASPDYAVVAQKDAEPAQLAAFDAAFDKEYGLTLGTLASRYDARAEARLQQAEALARGLEARALAAESHARESESHARDATNAARSAEERAGHADARAQQAESNALRAEAHAREAAEHVVQLLASKSWRLTAPLRAVADAYDAFRRKPRSGEPPR
jgi:O-antigen chain-terminating methyltransferase